MNAVEAMRAREAEIAKDFGALEAML